MITVDPEMRDYLNGKSFSKGYRIPIPRPSPLRDRFSCLEELFRGKRVLHVGCADHLPLIQPKLEQGIWMHDRLVRAADHCLGVDINEKAVSFLKNELGYLDVLCADLLEDTPEEVFGTHWDVVFLGEVIEHVDNPVAFLKGFCERFSSCANEMVITTPNAFRLENVGSARARVEVLNTDHRYWFSPYTLAKVVTLAGMEVQSIDFVMGLPFMIRRRFVDRYRRWLLQRNPLLRNTLLVRARLACPPLSS